MMSDKAKFTKIYDDYWLEIKRYLYVETGRDATLTDDIFQNTWINVYSYLSTLRDESNVRAWLYSIARNEARRYFHKNKTRFLSDVNEYADDGDENLEDEQASEYPDVLANEEFLSQLLNKLSSEEQQLILLHYYYDIPIREIAETHEINYNTLKSTIRRALAKLRIWSSEN